MYTYIIYVFLLLCLCILIVCLCIVIVPAGTLRLPWMRVFRAFSSVVRQMPGYNTQRQSSARTLCKTFCVVLCTVLCRSVYCLCVNVYCTTATGWQPNCGLTNTHTHTHTHTLGDSVGKVNSMRSESNNYNEKRVHTNLSNTEWLPGHNWLNLQIQKHCEW